MQLHELSPKAGAQVEGVDLREPVEPGIADRLRDAWHRYGLLLFRDQDIDEGQQRRVAEIFGDISNEQWKRRGNREDGLDFISNVKPGGQNPYGPLGFHFDNSMFEHPLSGLMLYAIEAPPAGCGGETLFSNVKLAYRSLPQALKDRIATLHVRHRYPDTSKSGEIPSLMFDADAPNWAHPLVFHHPVTGEPLLFMSRRHADRIEELPQAESAALIDELYGYIKKADCVTAHAWRPGDLVVWDNLMLQHGRNDFDPKHRRHLRRLQIA